MPNVATLISIGLAAVLPPAIAIVATAMFWFTVPETKSPSGQPERVVP